MPEEPEQQPQRETLDVESLKNSVNSLNNLLLGLQGYISFMESASASQQRDVSYLGPMKELVGRACDVANNIYNNMRGLPPGQRLVYPTPPPLRAPGVSPHPLGLSETVMTPPRDYHGPLQTTAPPPPSRDRQGQEQGQQPQPQQPAAQPPSEPAPGPQREDLSRRPSRVPPEVTPVPAAPKLPSSSPPPAPKHAPPPTRINVPTPGPGPSENAPPPPSQAPPAQPQPRQPQPEQTPPPPVQPQPQPAQKPAPQGGAASTSHKPTCPAEISALANLEIINREGARGLVMLVDDEEHLLYIASRMLAGEGFSVINCEEVFEAISIFEKIGQYIDLVILDFSMPTMNGEDVFYELTDIDPGVRIVLSSGIFEQEVISRLLKKGLKAFLPKPYKKESLLQTVTAAIGKR